MVCPLPEQPPGLLNACVLWCVGIYAGIATVRWLDMRYTNYNWQGWSELQGLRQRASRCVRRKEMPLGYESVQLQVCRRGDPAVELSQHTRTHFAPGG
jgi:hypothetical protein